MESTFKVLPTVSDYLDETEVDGETELSEKPDAAARILIIGDCREEALADIWRGHAISALRAQHRNNQRGGHATCGKCHWNQPWFKSPEVEAAAGAEQKTASAPMPAMMPRSWHLRETLE